MKNYLLAACVIVLSGSLLAQDSTAFERRTLLKSNVTQPLITIKGDEFRKFPSTNFLDAMNGLFPGVFSQEKTSKANDYLFVIDGLLLVDVNSISLYDVEEVSFSKANLDGNLFPFSKAGIFYITTQRAKENKPVFNFNSQYNAVWQKDSSISRMANYQNIDKKVNTQAGYLWSNHASMMAAGNRWDMYASAQLDVTSPPTIHATTVLTDVGNSPYTTMLDGRQRQTNFRSFAKFNYLVSSTMKVGFSGSYFGGQKNSDTTANTFSSYGDYSLTNKRKLALPYYHLAIFTDWQILSKLTNRVSAEYSANGLNLDGLAVQNFASSVRNTITERATHSKVLLLRDEISFHAVTSKAFSLEFKEVFSYVNKDQDYKDQTLTTDPNGTPYSISGYNFSFQQKSTSLNSQFSFSYYKFLSGYAGYAFLLNKGISGFNAASKRNIYAGTIVNIKSLLNAKSKLDRLDLSFHYSDITQNSFANYWLPDNTNAPQLTLLTVSTPSTPAYINTSSQRPWLKNKIFSVQANMTLPNDCLAIGVEGSKLIEDHLFLLPMNVYGGSLYIYIYGKERREAITTYVSAKLINQSLFKWNIRLHGLWLGADSIDLGNSYLLVEDRPVKDKLQAGLQNYFQYKNWSAQVHGLMALNSKTVNTFLLNYIYVGYDLSSSSDKFWQRTNFFVQARNLWSSKPAKNYYEYYTYGGVGVSVKL